MIRTLAVATFAACLFAATPSIAKTITVQLKDKGTEGTMVFEPGFVRAEPGDTIHFVPANASHDAELIPSMVPAGVTPVKGAMGKPFDLKVTTPGLYGVKCMPHYAMGMVGLIQVGKAPSNLAAVKAASLPPFAKARMTKYLAQVN